MPSRAASEYRYEKLTWPEINDAIDMGKVCIVPCGAVEQHGPHLPLDVESRLPRRHREGGGPGDGGQDPRVADRRLWLHRARHGFSPAPSTNDFEHFIHHVLDITKSLAYHGFKKIILLNGHGSNWPNLDLVARRTNLETDAECVPICWWQLLSVDKAFMRVAPEQVPRRLRPWRASWKRRCICIWMRQRAQGPDQERRHSASTTTTARSTGWTSTALAPRRASLDEQLFRHRRVRRAELATAEKGKAAYEEA